MSEGIVQIVIAVLGLISGGGLLALFQHFNTSKQQRKAAEIDNDDRELDVEREKLDLIEDYRKKSFSMVQEMLEFSRQGVKYNEEQKAAIAQLSQQNTLLGMDVKTVIEQTSNIERRISDIEEYLDGDFDKWRADKH